jgi:hypothetical protein
MDGVPESSLRSVPPAMVPCPLIKVSEVAPPASARISMPASHSPVISNARSWNDTQLADPACPSAACSFKFVLKQKCALAGRGECDDCHGRDPRCRQSTCKSHSHSNPPFFVKSGHIDPQAAIILAHGDRIGRDIRRNVDRWRRIGAAWSGRDDLHLRTPNGQQPARDVT